jgi:MoaA/NifB/PqqE/SkfB family radical SAM enzyme
MTTVREQIRHMFTAHKPIPAGTYTYQAPVDAPQPYRLHLRIEPDGSGVLILNAHTVLHLNPTATEYTYYLVQNLPEQEVVRNMATRYRVGRDQAMQDYRSLKERIDSLIKTPDLDPELFLDFERTAPYSQAISAPYRLDCALTYCLAAGSAPESAPIDRVKNELSTQEWKTIIDKAWSAGIPHVIFTGGEPTLREDLLELIAYCQAKGQVTGLLTDGLRMVEKAYLDELLQTGLDHLMLVLSPDMDASLPALEALLAADLFVAVHLTITPDNAPHLKEKLDLLAQKGVKAISLSASTIELQNEITDLRNQVAGLGLNLVWDMPVPYSTTHPISVELSELSDEPWVQGGGKAWLYVEPDGDVLPAQGMNIVLGNFLTDPWEKIWSQAQSNK